MALTGGGKPLPPGLMGPAPASGYDPQQHPNSPAYVPPAPLPLDQRAGLPPGYLDTLRGYHDASLSRYDSDLARNQNSSLYKDTYYGNLGGFANQDYALKLAQQASAQRMDDIDRNYAGQALGFGNQTLANLQRIPGLNRQALDTSLGKINLDELIRGTSANQDWRNAIQQAQSAQVSGGFGMAPGHVTGMNQTTEARDNILNSIHQGAMFDRQSAQNQYAQQDIASQNSIIGQQRSQLSDRAAIDKLNEKASQYGTDAATLKLSLDKSLADLGLNRFTNSQQLLEMASSTDAQKQALAEKLLNQLVVAGKPQA